MSEPRREPISMYIPARNAARTLAACVDAVRAQTRHPDELFIVVDPRSSDRTLEVARTCGVRVIEQRGATLGAARNEAIAAAGHRWLASCDSDAVPAPDWLERLAARRGMGAVGIGGRTDERIIGPGDAWRAMNMPHHWGDHPLRNPFMLVSEVLFDREALLAVGGYHDDLNYYEDSDLCQRLREAGYDLFYEPAAVATHLRTDDVPGVLTLRWKYSAYRQRHLLERYAGLTEKMGVNREYALNALSKALARGREELAYISYLLFFHHLVLDLRAFLAHRPMIDELLRLRYEHELIGVAVETVGHRHAALAEWVSADLDERAQSRDTCQSQSEAPRGLKPAAHCYGGIAGGHTAGQRPPGQSTPFGPPIPPAWPAHLEAVGAGVDRFSGEFTPALLDLIESSARYVRGRIGVDEVQRLGRPAADAIERQLREVPILDFVDERFAQSIRAHWPDTGRITAVGPLSPTERRAVRGVYGDGPRAVALAAHLESRADPRAVFEEVNHTTQRLVVCYQSPARFVPGLDVMSAADLASAASGAGWTIERFDTLVGRTRLMLSRRPTAEEAQPGLRVGTTGAAR